MEAKEGASSAVQLSNVWSSLWTGGAGREKGAGVGLPGISANASPFSPSSCLGFPFCRIILAATGSSHNTLGVSALPALPNVSQTPFLFNFQCLIVTGSQISLESLWYVWSWSRAGEAMLLEGRVRACLGLLCGHSFHVSKPPGIQISMVWNKELLAKSSGVSILDPKEFHYSGCSLAFTCRAEQICSFFPGYWALWGAAALPSLNNW